MRAVKATFALRYGPWALVLGASEGIGAAFSRRIAAEGVSLVLVARRAEPLEALASELRASHGVEVIAASLDLGAPDLSQRLTTIVAGRDIGLLVYNACRSVIAPYLETSLADKLAMLDVNCRGPLVATSLLAPRMVARGRGGIVLMSSMAGFQGTSMVGTYAASKAFDTVLGEALWSELKGTGVDVLVCAAGATSTPTFRAQTPADKQRAAFPMEPDAVAREALSQLGKEGPTWVTGALNRAVARVLRALPRREAVRFISRTTKRMYE